LKIGKWEFNFWNRHRMRGDIRVNSAVAAGDPFPVSGTLKKDIQQIFLFRRKQRRVDNIHPACREFQR
jgi:hypothetical protein